MIGYKSLWHFSGLWVLLCYTTSGEGNFGTRPLAAQYLIAASLVTVYAEVLARATKTPSTTFLIAAIIPLVPGSGLYYTMSYAITGSWDKFIDTGIHTLALSAALAAGIMVASSVCRIITVTFVHWKNR